MNSKSSNNACPPTLALSSQQTAKHDGAANPEGSPGKYTALNLSWNGPILFYPLGHPPSRLQGFKAPLSPLKPPNRRGFRDRDELRPAVTANRIDQRFAAKSTATDVAARQNQTSVRQSEGRYSSGIAPFFPVSTTGGSGSNPLLFPWRLFVFFLRIPFLLFAGFIWFAFIQWTPPGTILRKANLWCIIGIPGIWWVDLQVDGVRRGSLGKAGATHMPSAGSIVAASHTSPLDILYLATILDPIFTQSYPGSKLVRPISLQAALLACFTAPPVHLPQQGSKEGSQLTTLTAITHQNPARITVVFPEATPSNGRAILALTPALLSASPRTKIYPVSLRYTPADIVTPLPGLLPAFHFVWTLLSSSTHCIRTRIGAVVRNPPADAIAEQRGTNGNKRGSGYEANYFDTLSSSVADADEDGLLEPERKVLDMVADSLARLGRVKRVGLGVREKARFVDVWRRGARARRQ
ncbi:hypothetical protein Q7P37_007794 [Cladosporium fusiforme]